jgi:cysteine desulfurase
MNVYADHAATTPLDPMALDAMQPYLRDEYYNPSALYPAARRVRQAVENARAQVAASMGVSDETRIIFTGGGTESVNHALHSAAREMSGRGALISAVEHHAVLNSSSALAPGMAVSLLPVDRYGRVALETLAERLAPDVGLVSIMYVNNETGAINAIPALCERAHSAGALFHTDAVQALGALELDAPASGVDYLSVSSHKIYGPKGVGALYVREGAPVSPFIRGGGQERRLRAGTENVAGIVGFGRAAELLAARRADDAARLRKQRGMFLAGIADIGDYAVNSPPDGVPGIINVSFGGIEAEAALLKMSIAGVMLSMGAACNADSVEPSHVMKAVGLDGRYIRGTLRFSFGRKTTDEEVIHAVRALRETVRRLRGLDR